MITLSIDVHRAEERAREIVDSVKSGVDVATQYSEIVRTHEGSEEELVSKISDILLANSAALAASLT